MRTSLNQHARQDTGCVKNGSGGRLRFGYAGSWGYQAHRMDEVGTLDPPLDPDEVFPYLHVGARYYDPATGRFLQRDPIGIEAGLNVYSYVGNTPTRWVDPLGLNPVECQDQCDIWGGPGMGKKTREDAYMSCIAGYWPPPPARQALTEKTAEIERAKETIDAQVARRLKAESQRVAKEEAKKASAALATEMTDLRHQLDEKARKLDEAQKNQLELRKHRRDLEERQKRMQLEIERKLDTERKATRTSGLKSSVLRAATALYVKVS